MQNSGNFDPYCLFFGGVTIPCKGLVPSCAICLSPRATSATADAQKFKDCMALLPRCVRICASRGRDTLEQCLLYPPRFPRLVVVLSPTSHCDPLLTKMGCSYNVVKAMS